MKFPKKNFLIIGYQKASINILKKSLSITNRGKIRVLTDKNFSNNDVKKINYNKSIGFKKIHKYKYKYNIIIGTSEYPFESNIVKFLNDKNIGFFCYVDSIANLEERFQYFNQFPKKIISLNKIIIDEIKKSFKKQVKLTKFYNMKMLYQNYLKKKFFKFIRKDNIILYLSSDLGINNEIKNVKILMKKEKYKKIYICIHPRENKKKWIKKFIKIKNIKIFKNFDFFKNKEIKRVYGVLTTAMINYKFAGFDVYYFKDNIFLKNPIIKIIKYFKIKKYLN